MEVPFTQFLMPDGRERQVTFAVNDSLEDQVKAILAAKFCFQVEMLRTGEVSLTIYDTAKDEDIAIVVRENGPGMGKAIEEMITSFDPVKGQVT